MEGEEATLSAPSNQHFQCSCTQDSIMKKGYGILIAVCSPNHVFFFQLLQGLDQGPLDKGP